MPIEIDRNKFATLETAIRVGWSMGWTLISGLVVKRGLSVELGWSSGLTFYLLK